MLRLTEITLPIEHDDEQLVAAILRRLGIEREHLLRHVIFRRGVDARRGRSLSFIYTLDVELADEAAVLEKASQGRDKHRIKPRPNTTYRYVAKAPANYTQRPVVIGTGPCGIFAGLTLAQMGFRPIILERGKAVRERTKDTFGLWRGGKFDPESNVQFGEGGAGTFSDGKLYSQVKDRKHHGRKVLEEFVAAGAPPEILYVSKPHIGTFRLVGIVEHMRATIERLGGEIRFQSRVSDIEVEESVDGQSESRQVRGVVLADGERIATDHVVLAVGHSARDTFEMLHTRGVYIEPKAFSIGLRVEHPQAMVDKCRLHENAGNPLLGAADYKLVHHCDGNGESGSAAKGRSVYSFCMCPGGTVVAATSEVGCVVTNGMSEYSRNERNANAGIVVGISPEDFKFEAVASDPLMHTPLAGIALQRYWEVRAFEAGGGDYQAPAQLVGDFLAGKPSTAFGEVLPSYTPGVKLGDLSTCLPNYAVAAIREAIPAMDKKMKGFARPDALLTGVETRTSSPIRITRDEEFQSLNTRGLFPAGEGAGYAGGILSAGMDGIKVAEALALSVVEAHST